MNSQETSKRKSSDKRYKIYIKEAYSNDRPSSQKIYGLVFWLTTDISYTFYVMDANVKIKCNWMLMWISIEHELITDTWTFGGEGVAGNR